jgi:hypothetical protein
MTRNNFINNSKSIESRIIEKSITKREVIGNVDELRITYLS